MIQLDEKSIFILASHQFRDVLLFVLLQFLEKRNRKKFAETLLLLKRPDSRKVYTFKSSLNNLLYYVGEFALWTMAIGQSKDRYEK